MLPWEGDSGHSSGPFEEYFDCSLEAYFEYSLVPCFARGSFVTLAGFACSWGAWSDHSFGAYFEGSWGS